MASPIVAFSVGGGFNQLQHHNEGLDPTPSVIVGSCNLQDLRGSEALRFFQYISTTAVHVRDIPRIYQSHTD